MGLYKNVSGQKIAVYAYDTGADAPKTGDAANITAQISKDFGAAAATNDVNPAELDATDHPGVYVFDLTQAETNADNIILTAVSGTSGIVIDPVQVFTVPPNFRALGIESDGHVHADVKEIEGSDATNQIRDAVVDDATRIDASALNTAAGTSIPAILADTGTDGVVVASGSKSGYSLAADQSGVTVGTVNALGAQAKADVNAEVDTALTDYDPPTKAELDSAVDALPTAAENAAALLDLTDGIETGLTPRQAMRLLAAALAGELSGAATTTITIRNAVADSKDRITATVTSDGDRTAITYDLT